MMHRNGDGQVSVLRGHRVVIGLGGSHYNRLSPRLL
jgi:hypothetical protein